MITAAEFLKWCEVFHVATGGNPPTTVSLQVAYDNSSPKQIDISAGNLNFIDGQVGINVGTAVASASFQVDSTIQGTLPAPRMTELQLTAAYGPLTNTDQGLLIYSTGHDTYNYYSGSQRKELLAIENIVAGTNMSISNNGNGSVTFNSAGSTGPITSGQSAFVVNANPTDTTFVSIGDSVPILIDPTTFQSTVATNFSNFVNSNTPTAQLLETGTRQIFSIVNLSYKMNGAGIQNTYKFFLVIRTSPSSTITTTYNVYSSVTPLSSGLVNATLSGILPMSQDNSVEIWVQNVGGTDPIQITDFSFQAWDLTQQGYASTDELIQGSNNLYLSQDGGATYQNVANPVTVGNYAVFSTVGGEISDSGLPSGSANLVDTLQASTNADFYPVFVASTTNGYQQLRLSTGWSFNPNTNITTLQTVKLSGLTAGSSLLACDSGKVVETATGFYTLGGLTINNGGGPLLGATAPFVFDPIMSDGDYINIAGNGRNIGVTNAGTVFTSYNLDWDGSSATYKFNTTGNAFTVEVGSSGIFLKSATGGSAGTPVVPAVGLQMSSGGVLDIPFITDNSLVARVSGQITTAIGGSFQMAQLLLNSVAVPSLTQVGRLNCVGQNTTTDNAINLYTHTDGYPLINMVGTAHGTQYLNFDCYFDGTNTRSSSLGSNFKLSNTSNVLKLEAASGFSQGTVVSFSTSWYVDAAAKFYVNGVSASSFVTTDGSGAFTSTSNIFITSEATVTGSTQSAASNTRYYINYSGGQCVVTLPAATAGGGPIEIVGLSTASTSGWKAIAVGSDVIQFGSSVSAAAGNIVSTTGSATDAITLRPISGKWIVYPALGLNLVVT